ncbi:Protein LURP-one-related 8 [Apostasia shenzhenica]|uniref:Protein LURP-one-related 8 n=1 Tax=Apostasia shenzhenica TaxID=1088818 RepID=A0A2I0BGP2_9ASPA|nr:Protein LURP-one-related 8 [Apostasia shenzhenica]
MPHATLSPASFLNLASGLFRLFHQRPRLSCNRPRRAAACHFVLQRATSCSHRSKTLTVFRMPRALRQIQNPPSFIFPLCCSLSISGATAWITEISTSVFAAGFYTWTTKREKPSTPAPNVLIDCFHFFPLESSSSELPPTSLGWHGLCFSEFEIADSIGWVYITAPPVDSPTLGLPSGITTPRSRLVLEAVLQKTVADYKKAVFDPQSSSLEIRLTGRNKKSSDAVGEALGFRTTFLFSTIFMDVLLRGKPILCNGKYILTSLKQPIDLSSKQILWGSVDVVRLLVALKEKGYDGLIELDRNVASENDTQLIRIRLSDNAVIECSGSKTLICSGDDVMASSIFEAICSVYARNSAYFRGHFRPFRCINAAAWQNCFLIHIPSSGAWKRPPNCPRRPRIHLGRRMTKRIHPKSTVDGVYSPSLPPPPEIPSALTVWRKSLLFNCNGFTVFDPKGNLLFRVDNYAKSGNNGVIVLMDSDGNTLLTIRRKKLSLADQWQIYDGEEAANPRFSVRKHLNFLQPKSLAHLIPCHSPSPAARGRYEVEGSYKRRCCAVYDEGRPAMAEIRQKEAIGGLAFGLDVFRLVVQPGFDAAVAMAVVILMDEMFGSKRSLTRI